MCIGAVLIQWVFPWATRYLLALKPDKSIRILQIAISVIFLSVLPIAWYIWSFGRKVVKSQRMPPQGAKVIKTTKIVEGRSAVVRGKALMAMAILLALLGLIGAIWLPLKMSRLVPQNPEASEQDTSMIPSSPRTTCWRPLFLGY
jgi:hypothetical protein